METLKLSVSPRFLPLTFCLVVTIILGALLPVLFAVPMAQAGGMLGPRTNVRGNTMVMVRDQGNIARDASRVTRDGHAANAVGQDIARDSGKVNEEVKDVEHDGAGRKAQNEIRAADRDLHEDDHALRNEVTR